MEFLLFVSILLTTLTAITLAGTVLLLATIMPRIYAEQTVSQMMRQLGAIKTDGLDLFQQAGEDLSSELQTLRNSR
jgi:hypothetical protein